MVVRQVDLPARAEEGSSSFDGPPEAAATPPVRRRGRYPDIGLVLQVYPRARGRDQVRLEAGLLLGLIRADAEDGLLQGFAQRWFRANPRGRGGW